MRDPHNIKYRAVNLGNKTIAEKLLPANGAFEVCLINSDELNNFDQSPKNSFCIAFMHQHAKSFSAPQLMRATASAQLIISLSLHLVAVFLSTTQLFLQVLFSVGFEEDNDKLLLPLAASIQTVETFLEALSKL